MKKEIFIELTNNCNLKCKYCNKNSGGDFINLDLFENILKQIAQNYLDEIDFLCLWGGEPFLHTNIDNIFLLLIKYFKGVKTKFKIGINTNGLLIENNVHIINNLIKNLPNINFIFYVSLDGKGKIGNTFRGLDIVQYVRIIKNIHLLQHLSFLYSYLEISISSVLIIQKQNILNFRQFISYFKEKSININFCFQEYLGNNNFYFNKDIYINLLQRYLYLKKMGYYSIIESKKDLNNVLRIDVFGNIYNFLDSGFEQGNNFFISKNGDLSFLKNKLWILSYPNEFLWNIIYKDKLYIKFISKIFSSNE